MPKRVGFIHEKICTIPNIEAADAVARIGKVHKKKQIYKHDQNHDLENNLLLLSLKYLTFKTSQYNKFPVLDPKYRIISALPYYPDGIAHRAILNFCTPLWDKVIIPTSYSCIKGRGIHNLIHDVEKYIRSHPNIGYCLQMDYQKYFPSIVHENLKSVISRKIKDPNTLTLLGEIIDSHDGIPMGSWPSQYHGNLFPSYMFHEIIRRWGARIFVYMDDMLIFGESKKMLHEIKQFVIEYSKNVLNLTIKNNHRIFPLTCGINICGYVIYPTHTLLRKSMKLRIDRVLNKYRAGKITEEQFNKTMNSYFGWLKHCDSKHYMQKIENLTGLHLSNFRGELKNISWFKNKNVRVIEIIDRPKYFIIHCIYKGEPYEIRSRSKLLRKKLGHWSNISKQFNYIF